jgi:hypothetical protein
VPAKQSAPAPPAALAAARSSAVRSPGRAARRRSAVSEAPVPPQPAPAPALAPRRPQPVAVEFRPAPPPITFGELCGAPGERIGVTLVDTGVYARPSLGTPMVTRVVSGALVTIVSDSGEWLRVNVDGAKGRLSGFVYCTALRPLTPGGTIDSDSGTPDAP